MYKFEFHRSLAMLLSYRDRRINDVSAGVKDLGEEEVRTSSSKPYFVSTGSTP